MSAEFYTKDRIDRVVSHAMAAVKASQEGKTSIYLGDGPTAQRLELKRGGYCARFVRQVFETACGMGDGKWKYAAGSALEMCEKLAADGHTVGNHSLVPGDIIGINRNSGQYGHIALYVGEVGGKDCIAENTSSASRGNPRSAGTKLTPLSDVIERVTGVYRLRWGVADPVWPGFKPILCSGGKYYLLKVMPNGDHRMDQGKVYFAVADDTPIPVIR
jgi:hypothetical protein